MVHRDIAMIEMSDELRQVLLAEHPLLEFAVSDWTGKSAFQYRDASQIRFWDEPCYRLPMEDVVTLGLCWKWEANQEHGFRKVPFRSIVPLRQQIATMVPRGARLAELYMIMPHTVMIITDYRV